MSERKLSINTSPEGGGVTGNPMTGMQSNTNDTSIVIVKNMHVEADSELGHAPSTFEIYKQAEREAHGEKIVLPKLRRLYFANLMLGLVSVATIATAFTEPVEEARSLSPRWLAVPSLLGILLAILGTFTSKELRRLEEVKGVVNLSSPDPKFKRELSHAKMTLCFSALLSIPTALLLFVVGNSADTSIAGYFALSVSHPSIQDYVQTYLLLLPFCPAFLECFAKPTNSLAVCGGHRDHQHFHVHHYWSHRNFWLAAQHCDLVI